MSGGIVATNITGKADVTMTTNGDTLYYNSGRQRLAKGSDSQVLTLASGLPSWASATDTNKTIIFEGVNPASQINVGVNSATVYGVSGSEVNSQTTASAITTWKLMLSVVTSNSHNTDGTVYTRVNSGNGNQTIPIGAGLTGDFQDTSNTDVLAVDDKICINHYWGSGAGTVAFGKGSSVFV